MQNPSGTIIDVVDQLILCCMGYVQRPPNCAICWILLSSKVGPHNFFLVLRQAAKYIDTIVADRLEAQVSYDFKEWSRVMKILGFVCEAPRLRSYWGPGRDVTIYARVK